MAEATLDYYALLCLPPTATSAQIKSSYTSLARSFHPDKQTPITSHIPDSHFLAIKSAYKVLSNPTTRAAYDAYGHSGLKLLNPANNAELVPHSHNPKLLRTLIDSQMKYARLSALEKNVNTSGAIEMSTSLLPMTTGHASMPALKSISIHQNCQLPITPSVTLGISGFTTSSYGLGAGGCDLSLTKTLNRTTTVSSEVSVGESQKLQLSVTKDLSPYTHASTRFFFDADRGMYMRFSTGQFLDSTRNTLALFNVSPTGCSLSLNKSYPNREKLVDTTVSATIDPTDVYLRATANCAFTAKHTGSLLLKLGTRATELQLSSARTLSRFTRFSLGLRLNTITGVSWVFKFRRGKFSFQFPILFSLICNPSAVIYAFSVPIIIDECIQYMLKLGGPVDEEDVVKREEELIALARKEEEDARGQQILMAKVAERRVEGGTGVVVLKGDYGRGWDVTVCLQFFTNENGTVRLPAGSKSGLLGFYCEEIVKGRAGRKGVWNRVVEGFGADDDEEGVAVLVESMGTKKVELYVRYQYEGKVFEVLFDDEEEVALPSPRATELGDAGVVS